MSKHKDGDMPIPEEMVTLITEAIRFAYWAAGEGICPIDGEDARAPEDFLLDYINASNFEDWDGLVGHVRAAILTPSTVKTEGE